MQKHTVGKKTDWEQVGRSVLKTSPPCAADVPDIISWYKLYGGGTSKTMVPMIGAMFDKHVNANRMVSGSFFKTLGGLKFPADKPPALFLNATLIAHAAAREGGGRQLREIHKTQ